MFIHKGKKGVGEVQDSQDNLEKETGSGVNENIGEKEFCKCDPACQKILDELALENENCKKELSETKEKIVRVSADLQNFQRRVEKEKAHWIFATQSELLRGVLSFLDDFERAFERDEKIKLSQEVVPFLEGFLMTKKSIEKYLEANGVKEIIEIKDFDPNLHEAISQIDAPGYESGQIVAVAQKGYMLKDQVLRVARVVVAK